LVYYFLLLFNSFDLSLGNNHPRNDDHDRHRIQFGGKHLKILLEYPGGGNLPHGQHRAGGNFCKYLRKKKNSFNSFFPSWFSVYE
jgi:hypothetical protein